jgi:hypothetical protein
MLQELLLLLPKEAPSGAATIATIVAVAGLVFWAIAAKFSRFMVTLLLVAIGATIGMQVPTWLGWSIDGAGPAVAASVILGVSGFILHGFWMGLGLGIVAATWVALACWMMLRGETTWIWPASSEYPSIAAYSAALWQQLPGPMQRILPFGAAASLITGVAMAILWPRLTMALMWSFTGLTMLTLGSIAAASYGHPDLLLRLPGSTGAQAGILAMLLVVGAVIQWKLAPARRRAPPAAAKKVPQPQHVAAA